jgi:CTP synthase (UTP-ammonia lyase)
MQLSLCVAVEKFQQDILDLQQQHFEHAWQSHPEFESVSKNQKPNTKKTSQIVMHLIRQFDLLLVVSDFFLFQ